MREKFAGSQADRAESAAAAVAKKAAAAKKGGAPPASSIAGKLDNKAAGAKVEQKGKQQTPVQTQKGSPTEVRYQGSAKYFHILFTAQLILYMVDKFAVPILAGIRVSIGW